MKKCESFFKINRVPDWQKVEMAAMHLKGKAESWYQSKTVNRKQLNWPELVNDIIERFEAKRIVGVVDEFKQLRQKVNVEE